MVIPATVMAILATVMAMLATVMAMATVIRLTPGSARGASRLRPATRPRPRPARSWIGST
jgi:hypothetical protein